MSRRRLAPTPEVVYPGGSRIPVDRPRHRGRAHVLAYVRSLGRGLGSEVVVKVRAQDGTAVSGTHSKRKKLAGRKAATLARRRNRG